MTRRNLYRMVTTAALLAIGMVLPFLTGQLQAFGKLISPLHIPAFICGLTCGPVWGAALGLVLPILRSMVFGMPKLMPTAVTMMAELACYGLISGLMYPAFCRMIKQHWPAMILSLLLAMLGGRIAGGIVQAAILGAHGTSYGFAAFIASYFSSTLVGAAIHLIVVPIVVLALEKARLVQK